jgi:hypothetical protein
MRCLACGEHMVLVAVLPDVTTAIAGFEHQTHECSGCRTTEQRLVFSREPTRVPSPAAIEKQPIEKQTIAHQAATPEHAPDKAHGATPKGATNGAAATNGVTRRASNGAKFAIANGAPIAVPTATPAGRSPAEASGTDLACPGAPADAKESATPASAWARAVEKLRHREADLKERANQSKELAWRLQFNRTWESLGPIRRDSHSSDAETSKPGDPGPAQLASRDSRSREPGPREPGAREPGARNPASKELASKELASKELASSSLRATRARLRYRLTTLGRAGTTPPAAPQTNPEAIRQFNQLWDSLGSKSSGNGAKAHVAAPIAVSPGPAAASPVAPRAPAPLPRSLSLVPRECASAAGEALVILRGVRQ